MGKKVVIVISTILMLGLFGGGVYAYNTPEHRLERQLNHGNRHLKENKYEEAIDAYEKVIKLDPITVVGRIGMAKAYIAGEKLQDAEKVLEDALVIDAKNIDSRELLASVYLSGNRLNEAQAVLNEIADISPDRDETQLADRLSELKAVQASKEKYNEALKQMNEKKYLEAIELFKGVIEKDKSSFSEAQDKIKECKKLYIADNMQKARDEALNKKYESATNYLNLILEADPGNESAAKLKNEYAEAFKKWQAEEQSRKEELKKIQQSDIYIFEEDAMNIATDYAKKKYSKYTLMKEDMEQRDGVNYYVIRVCEKLPDHISTLAYYYISEKGGFVYEMDPMYNKLKPLS